MQMPRDGSAMTIAVCALMEIESTALSSVKAEWSPIREVGNAQRPLWKHHESGSLAFLSCIDLRLFCL